MIKSEEKNTEYCVILQPRYREHPPICMKGYAKDEEEATNSCFRYEWHKNVLDVQISSEIQWNKETIEKYWNMYGKYNPKEEISEIQLF